MELQNQTKARLKRRQAKLEAGINEPVADVDGIKILESDVTKELKDIQRYKPKK